MDKIQSVSYTHLSKSSFHSQSYCRRIRIRRNRRSRRRIRCRRSSKAGSGSKSSFRIRCFRRLRRIHSCCSRSYFHIHSRCCCRHNRYCRRIRSRLLLNHSCLFASKLVFMVYTMPYSMSVFPVVLPFFKIFFYSSFRQGCAGLSAREGPWGVPLPLETVIHRKGNQTYFNRKRKVTVATKRLQRKNNERWTGLEN